MYIIYFKDNSFLTNGTVIFLEDCIAAILTVETILLIDEKDLSTLLRR